MSMVPTEIENLQGAMWAEQRRRLIRHGKELSKLQQRIEALEKEREVYRTALEQYEDAAHWETGREDFEPRTFYRFTEQPHILKENGYDLARTALEQGRQIREEKP